MDEEEEDGTSIGAGPKSPKVPNPLNQRRRDREAREREQLEAQQQGGGVEAHQQVEGGEAEEVLPQSILPPFDDGSQILRDWTTTGLFQDPINQRGDTCGSVVFTRLTQAAYNKDKPIPQRRNLSYQHLANYIRSKTKKNSFSFRNLNIPINFIRVEGLHRDAITSGRGVKTTGNFDSQRNADAQTIFEKLETVPLGIVLELHPAFHFVGMEIYKVPAVRNEQVDEHALLALAKGRTVEGLDFIVVQNSWGTDYGNNGYCRIALPDSRGFDIFWPVW